MGWFTAGLNIVLSLLGFKKDNDAKQSGIDAQKNADNESNLATIAKANKAAKGVDDDTFDSNDRASRGY